MYRAMLEGDWVAAEMLLNTDPNLCSDEISEEGDRALHVAASMKHKKIVQKLVEQVTDLNDLKSLDRHGYTACCYAAISGVVEIADLMIRKDPTLACARDGDDKTPLHKAALHGHEKMVSYFLKHAEIDGFSEEDWFDLLLVTIRRRMFGVALKILARNEYLSRKKNNEGTALHLLARQPLIFVNHMGRHQRVRGVLRRNMLLLAKKLLDGIQGLGEASEIDELLKNPSIIHHAAEEGNVELITVITHAYPHLVWHTNSEEHTIFHIAANYRHNYLFGLINEIGARKDLIAISKDKDGNNILHLAAKLAPEGRRRKLLMAFFNMQKEMLWFKKVKANVPPLCSEMLNKDNQKPGKLFFETHKREIENSRIWIRNTSVSCMLISTLIFTVVFTSTFSVPGGYNQETGIPVLYRANWFTIFVTAEALAMLSSTFCIVCFLRIIMLEVEDVFIKSLPYWFVLGITMLSISMLCAITAFTSAYLMIYNVNDWTLFVIIGTYGVIVFIVSYQIFSFNMFLPERVLQRRTRHTLFRRPYVKNKYWRQVLDFLKF